MDLRFGQSAQLRFRYETQRNCFCTDKLGIEASPIIRNLDQDMTALLRGADANGALLGLAGSQPLLRTFDAVVRGVANHVRERIPDEVQHLAIELGLRPTHLQLHGLAELS